MTGPLKIVKVEVNTRTRKLVENWTCKILPEVESYIEPLLGEWTRDGIVVYWAKFKSPIKRATIKEWCTSIYGPELSTRNEIEWRWFCKYDKVVFRLEADRLIFVLRWS